MNTTPITTLWTRASVLAATLFGLGLAASAGPITYTDDFNRVGSDSLGTNWTSGLYSYVVRNNQATTLYSSGAGPYVTSYVGVDLGSGAFTVQADVMITGSASIGNGEHVGLIFNYQNDSNYNVVRWTNSASDPWGNLQAGYVKDGSYNIPGTGLYTAFTGSEPTGSLKTITVSGDGAGNYTLAIGSSTWNFSETEFTGGGAGLYISNVHGEGSVIFDNFALTVPEPASLGLLALGGLALLRRRR